MSQRWKIFVRENLPIALVTWAMTIGGHRTFYALKGLPWEVGVGRVFGYLPFFMFMTLVRSRGARLTALLTLTLFNLAEMLHLEYFGLRIHPIGIHQFIFQSHEIFPVLMTEGTLWLRPALCAFLPISLIVVAWRRWTTGLTWRWAGALLIVIVIYFPARTMVTGNNWGRQPSSQDLDGTGLYASISYYLGKILPAKLTGREIHSPSSPALELKAGPIQHRNIILVIGESLTPWRMSLFGPVREAPTTPFLDKASARPGFVKRVGLSGGVSTDVSLALFFNVAYGTDAREHILTGDQCLFRLAHKQGLHTTFFSAQSSQQLRYISNTLCPTEVERYGDYAKLDGHGDPNAADDFMLLKALDEVPLKEGGQFVVLHMRGSHGPFELRYPKDQATFNQGQGEYDRRRWHYDNSVLQTDRFFQALFTKLETAKVPTTMLFSSDHGEAMGQNKLWGHGMLKPKAYEIPVIGQAFHDSEGAKLIERLSKHPTQFEIGKTVLRLMGWEVSHPSLGPYTVLGNDLDGNAGFVTVDGP